MIVLVPSLGISLFNFDDLTMELKFDVLVPSLGISLFNKNNSIINVTVNGVLVPSLGISLFNPLYYFLNNLRCMFSSPLWGFLYLMGITIPEYTDNKGFSSPLWGFLYLMSFAVIPFTVTLMVLVPSLGISLFNYA